MLQEHFRHLFYFLNLIISACEGYTQIKPPFVLFFCSVFFSMPNKGKHVAGSQFDVPTSDIDPAYAVFFSQFKQT
jgi:hypothetical protein